MYDKLKEIREQRGLKQSDISSLLGFDSKNAYSLKERGERKFSLEEAKKLSMFFNMTIEDLFFANEVNEMETH